MDVIGILEGLVSKYSVPKEYLHVEITESALADDEGFLTKCVSRLKERGYALWLDDFGSGYSSLNVLKDFDFDVMKIDMKFLSGFENNAKAQPLIESVISMAEKLGMRTLTEGVETASEREFLSNANCERLQGYLFGKALPFEELQAKIKSGELPVSDHLL
jgi:EAL domain-containing protein (putative c-di-GMP-specific phosphodiesterase class I)